MNFPSNSTWLAQSASLRAAILGFGIVARWGNMISSYSTIVIVVGAIFHVWGMYVMQMKNHSKNCKNFVAFCLGLPDIFFAGYRVYVIHKEKLVLNGA